MTDIVIPEGPFETEPRAQYIGKDTALELITDALAAAGVELGAYDRRIVDWQAGWDSSSIVPLVSWLQRAAAEHERLRKSRDAFRDQRNAVFQTNERLHAQVEESGQARLLAENETRTARRELAAARAERDEARSTALAEAADMFDGMADSEPDQSYRARVMRGAANDVRRLAKGGESR
ncbi:hypothetical protein ACFC09_36325 [Streptomyces sp. NPDC056161]|uniref:hypothetical protein n=1 Tax=unclassified Streptomyces TaxID=2593676 RepID=UPI0035D76724